MKNKITPEEIEVKLIFKKLPKDRIMGFRVEWMSGEANGKKFNLDSGAGCGTGALSFHIVDGETYSTDVREVCRQLGEVLINNKTNGKTGTRRGKAKTGR